MIIGYYSVSHLIYVSGRDDRGICWIANTLGPVSDADRVRRIALTSLGLFAFFFSISITIPRSCLLFMSTYLDTHLVLTR